MIITPEIKNALVALGELMLDDDRVRESKGQRIEEIRTLLGARNATVANLKLHEKEIKGLLRIGAGKQRRWEELHDKNVIATKIQRKDWTKASIRSDKQTIRRQVNRWFNSLVADMTDVPYDSSSEDSDSDELDQIVARSEEIADQFSREKKEAAAARKAAKVITSQASSEEEPSSRMQLRGGAKPAAVPVIASVTQDHQVARRKDKNSSDNIWKGPRVPAKGLLWLHKEKGITPDDHDELQRAYSTITRIAYKTCESEEDWVREWRDQFECPNVPGGCLQLWLVNPEMSKFKPHAMPRKRVRVDPDVAQTAAAIASEIVDHADDRVADEGNVGDSA